MSKTALYLALLLILASACEDQIVTGPEPKGSELSTSDEEPRQLLLGAESMPLIISELATERGLNTAGKTSAISALESARSAETATVHFPHVTSSYATGHASYTDYYYPNQSYASTGFTLRRTTAYTTSGGSGSGTYPLPSGIANAVGDTFDEYVSASIGGPSKAAGSKSDREYVPFTPEPCRDLAQQCIGQIMVGFKKQGFEVTPLGNGKLEITLPMGPDDNVFIRHIYDLAEAAVDSSLVIREGQVVMSFPGSDVMHQRLSR